MGRIDELLGRIESDDQAMDRIEQLADRALAVQERFAALLEKAWERDDATLRKALRIVLRAFLAEGQTPDVAHRALAQAEALLEGQA